MSTGTAGSGSLPNTTAAGTSAQPAKRERYIERQLRRTRRQVRGVELASRLMLLAAAAVAFFLLAAVVDHWIVPGGLSIYGRLAFLAAFLIGGGYFVAREIAPLFVYRINPLFAAQTIERAKPTLKNSLLNFLMLRSNRAGVPEVVLSAVEEQAASNLERTSIEHVVDHTRLIQIGYLLLAMVAAFCTYFLLSPKSPLQTVGRVVLPWSDLQPPSRVEITDIQPGTATVFRGERASISAEVNGLEEGEAVTLFFSTADRQSVDQPLRLYVTKESKGRHTVTLPPAADAQALSPASAGLQQDIEYRIEAGDAVSRTHRLSVIQAPNIVVEKLNYEYPEYTRLDRQTVEKTGDIRAVEGTQVTVHALANQPIASAYLDLGGDGRHKQPMQIESGRAGGQKATATITLTLNDERTTPVFSHYFVRFVTDRGHENREPIRYRIEVTPDPAPEVQVTRPEKVETAVPLGAPVTFELAASDELYGLADLRIVANVGGEPAFRRNRSFSRDDPSASRIVHKQIEYLDRITLAGGQELKAGDVIEYWAEAADNKSPKPNVTRTEVRKLIIVEPKQDQNRNQQQEENRGDGQGKEDQQDNNQQDGDNKQPNERDKQNNQQKNEQKNGGQQNEKGKNDDAKNDAQKNDAGEKDGDNKSKGQQKNDQPDNSRGQQGEKDNNTERPEGAGDDKNRSDQSETNKEKSAENKRAKGDASRQPSAGRENQGGDSAADAPRNEQRDQNDSSSQNNNADRQEESQNDEKRPVDQSDEGEALKRILEHAKEKDGKTPEQQNDAKDDQRKASAERGSEQEKSDGKGADKTKQEGGSTSAKKEQTQRADDQPGGRDEQRGKTNDAQKETAQDQKRKRNDAQKTGADAQKNETSKTEESPQNDDSQEAAKKGTAKSDQRKTEDRGKQKSGPGESTSEQDSQPMTDDATAAEKGAQKDDTGKQEQTGASSGSDRDDAKKRPQDEQAKGASDSGEKRDGDKSADQKSAGSDAKKTEKQDAKKQDRSKSDATASDEKNEKTPSGEEKKGPSEKGATPDDVKGQSGQPGKNKSGESKSHKDGQPGDTPPRDGDDKRGDQKAPPDGKGSVTGGGGGPRDASSTPPPDEPPVPPEDDKANIEYAKRATDLALDHLRNQLKDDRPDEELLDRLGWSKEDLKKLLARWERLQREAKQPGPAGTKAKENLQESINSLGWKRPGQSSRKASISAGDAARSLRESARSAPPQEYIEAFEAFKRRTSQGEK
jgi:hypothetical protein